MIAYSRQVRACGALLLASALVGCTPTPVAGTSASVAETLVVTSTADGDTFTGRDVGGAKIKVRLLSIDAPEEAHNGKQAACGAHSASARLHALIAGKTVTLVGDSGADDTDQYQRRLRYAEVDGRDIALTLVAEGLVEAWYPKSEPRPERFDTYAAAQRSARESHLGSWQSCDKLGR
jgi:micrococcal nuclease